jgi:hypothetical protein
MKRDTEEAQSSGFKARVAAIKGERTTAELASDCR